MDKPATYRIQVRGELNRQWSARLAGMSITTDHPNDRETRTTLVGLLKDQAALSGVLNTLYELQLPVVSVECLPPGRRG